MSELVEVAFVGSEPEAAIIQALLEEHGIPSLIEQSGPSGPQLGYGLLNPGGGSRRVLVHAHLAERARALIEHTVAENELLAEPVNARHLEEAEGGRRPRDYGLIGGYARAYFWSFVALAAAFAVFMALRAL